MSDLSDTFNQSESVFHSSMDSGGSIIEATCGDEEIAAILNSIEHQSSRLEDSESIHSHEVESSDTEDDQEESMIKPKKTRRRPLESDSEDETVHRKSCLVTRDPKQASSDDSGSDDNVNTSEEDEDEAATENSQSNTSSADYLSFANESTVKPMKTNRKHIIESDSEDETGSMDFSRKSFLQARDPKQASSDESSSDDSANASKEDEDEGAKENKSIVKPMKTNRKYIIESDSEDEIVSMDFSRKSFLAARDTKQELSYESRNSEEDTTQKLQRSSTAAEHDVIESSHKSDEENDSGVVKKCPSPNDSHEEDFAEQSFHNVRHPKQLSHKSVGVDSSQKSAEIVENPVLVVQKPKRSHRFTEQFAREVLSSTMIHHDEPVHSASTSDVQVVETSADKEVFIINSDSDNEVMDRIAEVQSPAKPAVTKQANLQDMFNRLSVQKPLPSVKVEVVGEQIFVTQKQFRDEKANLNNVHAELQRVKNVLSTLNMDRLPDRGSKLKEKESDLTVQYKRLAERIENLKVIDEDAIKTAPKPASWNELNTGSSEVQPRTFGKQAMATHNLQKALTMDRLHQLHGSLKTCPADDIYAEAPKGLKVELLQHQKHALAWLIWRESQKPAGGILADDMGLGKTLTMISLVLKQRELKKKNRTEEEEDEQSDDEKENHKRHKYQGGTLVVCPASLLSQWEGEIRNRVSRGLCSVELYHGPKRETKSKYLASYDFVITTYAIAKNEHEKMTPLFKIKWDRVILDEAHQIRNHKTVTSLAVCNLAAKSRWTLTGTPIHNKEEDMFALLKFIRCSPFDDINVFKRWTNKATGGSERINTVISCLMLRRTKAQLQILGDLKCLPERLWSLLEVKLENEELNVYHKILVFSRTLFAQFLHQRAEKDTAYGTPSLKAITDPNGEYYKMHQKLKRLNKVKDIKQHEILVLLLRLRQICCHPSLITAMLDDEVADLNGDDDDDEETDQHLDLLDQLNKLNLDEPDEANISVSEGVGLSEATRGVLNKSHPVFRPDRRSAKLNKAIEVIKEKVKDDKAIVVSQWSSLLRLMAIQLKQEGIDFDQLDGTIPVPKRSGLVDNFNNPNSPTKILLLSLTAGGVGLNLVGANHLLLLDLHWNPQLEMQAQDRIYRVGQTKPVFVYKFMTVDTIEQRINMLQESKKALAEAMITGSKIQRQNKLSMDDLKMLFNM